MLSAQVVAVGVLSLVSCFALLLILRVSRDFSGSQKISKRLRRLEGMCSLAFLGMALFCFVYLLVALWVEMLK